VHAHTETFEYKNLKFVLWDVGGQTSLRTSWSQYLTSTHAVRHACAAHTSSSLSSTATIAIACR